MMASAERQADQFCRHFIVINPSASVLVIKVSSLLAPQTEANNSTVEVVSKHNSPVFELIFEVNRI